MAVWQIITLAALVVVLLGGSVLARANDALPEWLLAGGLCIALAGFLVVAIPIMNADQARWEQWCHAQGGHVTDHTDTTTVVTIGANGQPAIGSGSSTTYYCLTADGRVLDVR
jgi:hypothetical protein